MSSPRFPGGGASDFYGGAGGFPSQFTAVQPTMNNHSATTPRPLYRSQPSILLNPSSHIAQHQPSPLIGKRTLAEFQTHRDLKPQNLLLDAAGNLKVSDFGLSALPEHLHDGLLHTACGTPAFTAPEILRRVGYDGSKADAWSCGVILYNLLAGHLPFDDSNIPALRASHSTLLYMLSPREFTFSLDPLRLTWHHARPPRVWRTDPIVARVGSHIILAGGACDFEDEPLAVEAYDTESLAWLRCEPMPEILKGSTASTWLAVAVSGDKMHVTEKKSGVTYSFDCGTMTWQGPYNLRPSENVFYCVTGTIRGRLMVAGLVGDAENVKEVKLWEVKGELGLGLRYWCEEIGAIPKEMVVRLVMGEGDCCCCCWGVVGSIEVHWVGDYVYFQNRMEMEMVVCEVVNGRCEWWSVRNVAGNDVSRMGRMVFCGGHVGLEDLKRAIKA